MIEENPVLWSFLHLYHLDKSNAAIHMAEVKFSPVVFALAVFLAEFVDRPEIDEVIEHKGKYPIDTGR